MNRRYVVRRLLQLPLVLGAILVITFTLVHNVPGDPAGGFAGPDASADDIARIRHQYGLDRPVVEQFFTYGGRVVRGDLGQSSSQGRPVAALIRDYAKPTLLLTGTALFLSTVCGILFAVMAVRKPFGWLDKSINGFMLMAYAVPGFWLAQVAILYPVLRWHMFPLQGYSQFGGGAPSGVAHLADVGRHLMLPALVLAVTEVAAITRVVRSGLLGELGQGYVRAAEAKGLKPDEVMSRHALRNALLPMITVIGARVGFLLSGAAIIESIFVWPGLGSLLLRAADHNDHPLMLGMVLVASFAVVTANLLTDLLYRWVDPRIRYD
jgi:peptide/nickel transport system permease protein